MNLKQELLLFYTFLLSLGGVFVNIIMLIFSTEAELGYVALGSPAAVALYAICAVAVAVFLVGIVAVKKGDIFVVYHDTAQGSQFGRISIILFILGLAFHTVIGWSSFLRDGFTAFGGRKLSLTITFILLSVMAVFLFVCLFMMLFSKEEKRGTVYELAQLAPVLFSTVRLVDVFIKYTGSPTIPSRGLEILSLVSLLLFFTFYANARTKRGSIKFMYLWGLPAIFFTAVSAIPSLILVKNFNSGVTDMQMIATAVLDIVMMVYVIAAIFPVWVVTEDDSAENGEEEDDEEYFEETEPTSEKQETPAETEDASAGVEEDQN